MKTILSSVSTSLLMLSILLFISGCTGTKVNVYPSTSDMNNKCEHKYASISIKDLPSDYVYPPAGKVVEYFAHELDESGICEEVLYPSRRSDKPDLTLETKFDVQIDPHMGISMLKAFATGLTLFILEPVFWYNFDYEFKGSVNVLKNGEVVDQINKQAESQISMKYLSLANAQKLEGKAIADAKKSLSNQIIMDLNKKMP